MSSYEDFVTLVENNRAIRHWSRAELARRAGITQPEISRALGGGRMPTLRHVRGLVVALAPGHFLDEQPGDHGGLADAATAGDDDGVPPGGETGGEPRLLTGVGGEAVVEVFDEAEFVLGGGSLDRRGHRVHDT